MIHSFRYLTLESLEDEDKRMERNESEYLPQNIHLSNKGKQDLFGEWMDSIKHLDAYVINKLTDMENNDEGMDYMDEDPLVLMLRKEGTHWEPLAIIETTIELKNWAWEGVAHPMEDSMWKIKIVKPVTLVKKIKILELVTLAKNIVFIPIKFVSASIIIPIKSVCDSISVESISIEFVKSVKSVENFFHNNMISDSFYLLALNVFISEIGKETLNNKELKQGHLEPIKEETQPINLETDDEPKMIQMGNTLTTFEKDALVALLRYRTSIPSSIGVTPYSLVYGMKVVLPIEMGVRSLRTILKSEIPKVDWLQSKYDQLCMLDEKRLKALYHIQG